MKTKSINNEKFSWENTHNPFYCFNFLTSILDKEKYKNCKLDDNYTTMIRVTKHILDHFSTDFNDECKTSYIDKLKTSYDINIVNHSLDKCTGYLSDSFKTNRDYSFNIYLTRIKEDHKMLFRHIPINMLKQKIFYAMFNEGITRYPSRMIFVDVVEEAINILKELFTSVDENNTKTYFNDIKIQRDRLENKYFKGVFECIRKILIEGIPDLLETMYMISIIDTIQDSNLDGFTSLIENHLVFGYDKENKKYKVQKLIDKFIYMIPIVPIINDLIDKEKSLTYLHVKKALLLLKYTPEIEYIENSKIDNDLDKIAFALFSLYNEKEKGISDHESYLETQLYLLDLLKL